MARDNSDLSFGSGPKLRARRLRTLAQGLAREFGPAGIHVAHVIVDSVIQGVIEAEYAARAFPAFVTTKGADGLLVADAFWGLHQRPVAFSCLGET